MSAKSKLNDKQIRFCHEYLKDYNASEAYRRAGYNANKANRIAASKLLTNVNIQEYLHSLKQKQLNKAEIDAQMILKKLKSIAFSRIDDYVEFEGTELKFKAFSKLTEQQLEAIESIKNTRHGIEIKLHGVDWSIEKIARHINFYEKEKDNDEKVVVKVIYGDLNEL